jgi:hypothetical protein
MSWRDWGRAVAVVTLMALCYAEAARTDEAANQDVLAALENGSARWGP